MHDDTSNYTYLGGSKVNSKGLKVWTLTHNMILSDTRPGGETNAIDTLPRCILHNMMDHTSPGAIYSFVTAFAKVGVKFVQKIPTS